MRRGDAARLTWRRMSEQGTIFDALARCVMTYEPSDIIDGKFRVIRILGEGGMGTVYEVEHIVTKHHRALKLLHPALLERPIAVERFLREASAAGRVGDSRIVETYDGGHLRSGEPFVVMELLSGCTLGDWVTTQRPRFSELLEAMAEASTGLHRAHEAGIIHRDLKPDNLFVTDDGQIKILDFGVSKFTGDVTREQRTATGAVLGTPHFMSPEQFDDVEIDGRSDVFAMGVILYRCACGTHPFAGDTLGKLAKQIMLVEPPPPSEIATWLPPAFDQLVATAMQKDRAERFADAGALAQALTDLVAGAPDDVLSRELAATDATTVDPVADTDVSIPPPTDVSVDVMASTIASMAPTAPSSTASPLIWVMALLAISSVAYFALRGTPEPETPVAAPPSAATSPTTSAPAGTQPSSARPPVRDAASARVSASAAAKAAPPPVKKIGTKTPPPADGIGSVFKP